MTHPAPRLGSQARRRAAYVVSAISLAVIVAVGAFGTHEYEARFSAGYCSSCHTNVRSHANAHRNVSCQSCHETTLRGRIAMGIARLRHTSPSSGHAPASSANCTNCHEASTRNGRFASTEGHRIHARAAQPVDCVRCHSGALHDRPSPREGCRSCHGAVPLLSEPRDEASCVQCHEFSADSRTARAARRIGVQGTGPTVDASRLHGSVDCRQCHNPHRPRNDPSAPLATRCTNCHGGDIEAQVQAGPEGHRSCLGCHAVHASRQNGTPQCDRCHIAPERTTPAGPMVGATPTPPMLDPAAPGGNTTALRTWRTLPNVRPPAVPDAAWQAAAATPRNPGFTHGGRCASCHRPHTWRAQPTDCRGCHTAQATSLGFETPHGRNGCLGCHDPHGPRPNASACAACHSTESRLARNAPPAPHQVCTSCHEPHAPVRPTAATCMQCHALQRERVANGPLPHTNCLSCHTPHGPPRPTTPNVCATCHSVVTNWFASNDHPPQHRCEGCHANHDFSRPAARVACLGCHQDLASHRGSHLGDCVSCHAPHAPFAVRDLHNCASCHSTQHVAGPPRMQAGHARCEGCHLPHRARAIAATQCGNCHRVERDTAASWPAGSPHAGACVQCHQPHRDDAAFPVCANCHAAQATPNHYGRHAQCTMCHVPHRDRPAGGGAAWWTRCAECHRNEAGMIAAATTSATHRQCANCHQRPGLRPPTCVTCHSTIPSTLLHAVPQHGTCLTCHQSHGNAPPARAQCVACHTDRSNHFPDAPTCQACHPFRPGARIITP